MGSIVVPYDTFTGGDWGLSGPANAPQHSYSALNMYLTRAGELTVRPGLKNITPASGMPTTGIAYLGAFGEGDSNIFFQASSTNALYDLLPVPNQTPTTSAMGSFITDHDDLSSGTGNGVYAVTSGAGVYNIAGGTATALTGSPNGNAVALYLNRVVVATGGNTLRWSDQDSVSGAPLLNSWTSTNTVSVGDSSAIVAIRQQGVHLIVYKQRGIYVITGDMPVATLRQVSRVQGPSLPGEVRLARDGILWAMPAQQWPQLFDGTKVVEVPRILIPSTQCAVTPIATDQHGMFFNTAFTLSWLFMNGAWTKHAFPASLNLSQRIACVQGTSPIDPGNLSFSTANWDALRPAPLFVFADNSAAPQLYASVWGDRPGSEVSTGSERAGDASAAQVAGSVTFPEWHSSTGEDVLVRSVIVDYRAWNTGGSLTNHFDLTVTSLRQYNSDGNQVSAVQSYDEAGEVSPTGGTIQRRIFSFGDQGTGNGFQVALSNVRGVSIRRVTVLANTSTTKGAV